MPWYYMSFADPALPKGTRFLGGLILEASDVQDAIRRAHMIGENPGGEVLLFAEVEHLPPEQYRGRLLTKDELSQMEIDMARP